MSRNSPSARYHRALVRLAEFWRYKTYGPLVGPKEAHQPDPRWCEPKTCRWPDPPCDQPATVTYTFAPDEPTYCGTHADELDRLDASLGFPGAKARATQ